MNGSADALGSTGMVDPADSTGSADPTGLARWIGRVGADFGERVAAFVTAESAIGALRSDLYTGQSVLVTGGTSGIGAAIAEGFARLGATVTAAGLPSPAGPPAVAQVVELDVRDEARVLELMGDFDQLHVLVNAAGVIRRDAEYELDVFTDVLDIN